MAAIELRNIVKVFSDKRRGRDLLTLDNINLDIEANDFVCLLGLDTINRRYLERLQSAATAMDGR